jgi:hypothetical protein
MPEIGLFGSEGGAPTHGVPTLSWLAPKFFEFEGEKNWQ